MFSQILTQNYSIGAHILHIDDSTCCDEDFTWVASDQQPEPRSLPLTSTKQLSDTSANGNNIGKPPRPTGSLDRRRASHTNRHERDCKSRSAHYMKDRSTPTNEFKDIGHNNNNKGSSLGKCTITNF